MLFCLSLSICNNDIFYTSKNMMVTCVNRTSDGTPKILGQPLTRNIQYSSTAASSCGINCLSGDEFVSRFRLSKESVNFL